MKNFHINWTIAAGILALACATMALGILEIQNNRSEIAAQRAVIAQQNAALAQKNAVAAQKVADKLADELRKLATPWYTSIKYVSLRVNGGPLQDIALPVFVHRCDKLLINRLVIATEPTFVSISRTFTGGGRYVPLSAGAKQFVVGLNSMAPIIQVPSDLAVGSYVRYESSMGDLTRPAPIANLPDFVIYILADGEPAPAQGDRPQKPPPPSVGPTLSCPAITSVPHS